MSLQVEIEENAIVLLKFQGSVHASLKLVRPEQAEPLERLCGLKLLNIFIMSISLHACFGDGDDDVIIDSVRTSWQVVGKKSVHKSCPRQKAMALMSLSAARSRVRYS